MGDGRRPVDDQSPGKDPQRYRPSLGSGTRRMNRSAAPRRHPNHHADRQLHHELAGRTADRVQARRRPTISRLASNAIPTGSLAPPRPPDGPAPPSDLPASQHREHHRRIGRGQRSTQQQRRPPVQAEQEWARVARAAAVTKVPATPTQRTGPAALRNRRQPICIPPSNKMTASATDTTRRRWTTDSSPSAGATSKVTAAATRKNAGAGSGSVR